MADANTEMAEVMGGLRASLIQQGFSPEQAGDLAITINQQMLIQSAAENNRSFFSRKRRR